MISKGMEGSPGVVGGSLCINPGAREGHLWKSSLTNVPCLKGLSGEASLHPSVLLDGASQNHRLQVGLGGAGRSLVW